MTPLHEVDGYVHCSPVILPLLSSSCLEQPWGEAGALGTAAHGCSDNGLSVQGVLQRH